MTCAAPRAEVVEAVDRAQLSLALASVSYMSGDVNRSKLEAEAVLAEPRLPEALYAAAEQTRLLAMLSDGRIAVIRHGSAQAAALLARAALAWRDGHVGSTLKMLSAANRARESGRGQRCFPGLGLATVFATLGQFDDARACLLSVADEITFGGEPLWTAAPAVFSAAIELAAGQLDAACTAANSGLELADKLGTPMLAPIAQNVLMAVALRRGELGEAARLLTQWRSEAIASRLPFGTPNRQWVSLRLREAHGAPVLGDGAGDNAFDLLADDRSLLLEDPAAAAWLVRVALRAGDDARARAVVATVERLAAANPRYPSVVAAAAHAHGLVAREPDTLATAVADHRSPWARASAEEDSAAVHRQRGDRAMARSWLERAAEGYLGCGATRDCARIRSRLLELGVRRRHWSRQQRPVSGWESLTETEHTVAALVAEGLSNQEVATRMFLSRHTVDFHLRHIFRKLGIDSRVVLTRIALANGEHVS
jgi:DNA-binding CsgD family transcriptional regulator